MPKQPKAAPVFNYATPGSKVYGKEVPPEKVAKLCAEDKCFCVKPGGGVTPVAEPVNIGPNGHGGVYANGIITYH